MHYLRKLDELVLDHRFRRMMETLLQSAEEVYAELGLPFRARWTSTYLLLRDNGPMPIVEIANQIGLTHPTVINITNDMAAAGLLDQEMDAADRRRRLVRLSDYALALSSELERVWKSLSQVQRDRFQRVGCDIIDVLNQFEDQLSQRTIKDDVLSSLEVAGRS
jgi:DNA-binding MarR family transcriptional regulator